MLTRSLVTSVLPGERRRLRARLIPGLRAFAQRIAGTDRRSLEIRHRVEESRGRCLERHVYGRARQWF
jgi:hypothetical protein